MTAVLIADRKAVRPVDPGNLVIVFDNRHCDDPPPLESVDELEILIADTV
jgi:hypothetical protein